MCALRYTATGAMLAAGLCLLAGGPASAQSARITKLSDVAFGTLSSTASDVSNTQNVCVYVQTLSNKYSIRATGSGSGGAFTLAGVGAPMPYEVQWAASSNQSSGTTLTAGTALTGQSTVTIDQTCSIIITSTASLIILLRAAALGQATAGAYSGTLTLVVAPE